MLKSTLVFSEGLFTIRIINYRILQALGALTERKITARQLWDVTPNEPSTEYIKLARQAYDRFLTVLDKPDNRHMQSIEQLTLALGQSSAFFYQFFGGLWKAYPKSHRAKAGDPIPRRLLTKMAEALGCSPTEIVSVEAWQKALTFHDEQGKDEKQPEETIAPAPQPVIAQEFHEAAVKLVQGYIGLSKVLPLELALLCAVEQVNPIQAKDTNEIKRKFFRNNEEVEAALQTVKTHLCACTGIKDIESKWVVAALKIFESPEMRLGHIAAQTLSGRAAGTEREYAEIGAPAVSAEAARTAHQNVLNRMAAALQGGRGLTEG